MGTINIDKAVFTLTMAFNYFYIIFTLKRLFFAIMRRQIPFPGGLFNIRYLQSGLLHLILAVLTFTLETTLLSPGKESTSQINGQ